MASQGPMLKLVTWRVKDWASCLFASKIPLGVDEDGVNNNVNTTNSNNLTLKRIKRKLKSTKKMKSESKQSQIPPGTRHHHFHLRASSVTPTSPSQPPVSSNRKFIYGDREVRGTENNNLVKYKVAERDNNDTTTCQEAEDVPSHEIYENNEEEEEEIDASDKSSGSNHSDEGRRSFAFPILGEEWIGSPVQMPKLDDLSPKKQKQIALGFQCCRF